MKKLLALLLFVLVLSSNAQNYIVETPVTNLVNPSDFALIPGTTRVIVTLKTSGVKIYDIANNTEVSTFWTFSDSLNSNFERGVLGICLDPNFTSNRYVYVYYVHSNPPNSSTNQRVRVVRFTESGNVGTNPHLVINHLVSGSPAGNHFGGIIRIRQSDPTKLFCVLGDIATSSNAQLLTNPYGKMLRVNTDGTIPNDNPFYDDGNPLTGNDDRIWTYGLRNAFGFCFSNVNDSLYEAENGASSYDEVNKISKGRNYGWPSCEGYCNPYNPLYKQPMHVWGPGSLPALTGIMVYNGAQMPWLNGKLLIADNDNGYIYQCTFNNTLDSVVSRIQILDLLGLTTLTQGPDDYIYALNGGYAPQGRLYRIKPDPTGIDPNGIPVNFRLDQNYPNPFNPVTSIKYSLANDGFTAIKIFDVTGNEVALLVNGNVKAGEHEAVWDAAGFSTGVYFCRMTMNGQSVEKKMVLVK
jgi:glucose/arabinose dehydrogenase